MIKAVLFDVDGTIIESKNLLLKAFNLALKDIGEAPVDAKIFEMAKSKELGTIGHYVDTVLGKPEKKAPMYASYAEHYTNILQNEVKLIPGVLDVFQVLREDGIGIGIQTTQYRAMLDVLLDKFVLNPDASVARDEVVNKKPAPDQIFKLCEMLGIEAGQSVVVGDWVGDIRAGKAAGSKTVGVLTGINTEEELSLGGADMVVQDVSSVPGILPEL